MIVSGISVYKHLLDGLTLQGDQNFSEAANALFAESLVLYIERKVSVECAAITD